jgi:hypothetical protein
VSIKNAVFWDIKTQFVSHRKHYVSATEPSRLMLRYEVFTAVTMKNVIFLDVTPCGSCKNRRFGGRHFLILRVKIIDELVTAFL